jgi:hypothetical protein
MKNQYNIEFIDLKDNFDNVKIGKYHYNYKTVDFMFNYKENAEKTLITFHARVRGTEKLPIFAKYNYENEKINVLSLDDKLLEFNRSLHNTLYYGTKEIPYDEYYIEIIEKIFNLVKTKKNIFFGSCSGSIPALYYGSIFNGIIVSGNGFVYPEKETITFHKNTVKKLSNLNFKFDYIDTKEQVIKYKPKHIYIYINKNDTFVFNQNKDFIIFCKKNIPDKITAIIHDTKIEGKDAHDIFYPEEETFESVIEKI